MNIPAPLQPLFEEGLVDEVLRPLMVRHTKKDLNLPEPGTSLMFALGLIALQLGRRRRYGRANPGSLTPR